MINTLFVTTEAVEPIVLLLSFSTRKHMSVASRSILSNFFEEQCPQNHPQCLSGLSRALFPTTVLEIAVYTAWTVRAIASALTKWFFFYRWPKKSLNFVGF